MRSCSLFFLDTVAGGGGGDDSNDTVDVRPFVLFFAVDFAIDLPAVDGGGNLLTRLLSGGRSGSLSSPASSSSSSSPSTSGSESERTVTSTAIVCARTNARRVFVPPTAVVAVVAATLFLCGVTLSTGRDSVLANLLRLGLSLGDCSNDGGESHGDGDDGLAACVAAGPEVFSHSLALLLLWNWRFVVSGGGGGGGGGVMERRLL